MEMDIGSAFTYMFDDEDWIKKVGIGGVAWLLAIVVVPIFLVLGYMLQTIKNVRDGHPKPLPEWDNLGEMIVKGLMVFVIAIIYNIVPLLIIFCPLLIIPFAAGELDSDAGSAIAIIANCFICVGSIISIVVNLVLPAALIRYAQYDTIGSALQFGEIFSFISSNVGDYIIVVLLGWVASFVAAFGLILCLIGVYFTNFWAILVTANLYGQLARKAT